MANVQSTVTEARSHYVSIGPERNNVSDLVKSARLVLLLVGVLTRQIWQASAVNTFYLFFL